MPAKRRRHQRRDSSVVRTEPDLQRATGNDEDDEFEAQPGEVTTSSPRKRKSPSGSHQVAAAAGAKEQESQFPFMKLPAEVRNMIYRYLVLSDRNIDLGEPDLYRRAGALKGWYPAGIQTAILRVNRQVCFTNYITCLYILIPLQIYDEAAAILYNENKCEAYYQNWDLKGIRIRKEDPKTKSITSRNLRSGRSVDMVKHTGGIPEECLHRLRHVHVRIMLPSRENMCIHMAASTVANIALSLEVFFEVLLRRLTKAKGNTHGRHWVITITNRQNSQLNNSLIKTAIRPLLTYEVCNLLKAGLLTMEVEGEMPKNWLRIFWKQRGLKTFFKDKVPDSAAPAIHVGKDFIRDYLEGFPKYWEDSDDDFY